MEMLSLDQKSLPQILSYKCVLTYLSDYFTYRKSQDNCFSYESWSFEMGFKSRAFLKMISSGKRNITQEFINIFATKVNFSETEKLHFTLLSKIQYEKSKKLKDLFQDSMFKTLDLDGLRKDLDDQVFLKSMYNPIVQMLIGFKDFIASEENMVNLLPLDLLQIRQVLKELKDLGLAEEENSVWKSKIESFRIKDNQSEHVKRFHQNTLKEAALRLEQADIDDQMRSIYFSATKEAMPELKLEIEEFLKKIRNKYGSYHLDNQQIVKMNLQLYPVTQIYKKSNS